MCYIFHNETVLLFCRGTVPEREVCRYREYRVTAHGGKNEKEAEGKHNEGHSDEELRAPDYIAGGVRFCVRCRGHGKVWRRKRAIMRSASFRGRLLRGIRAAITSDKRRREALFLLLNMALALTSFIMSVVNIFTHEYILLAVTLSFCAACLLNTVILRFTRRAPIGVYIVFGAEVTAIMLFFFITGIPNGFSALWVCLIPSFALLVLGFRYGSAVSLLAFGGVAFLFWLPVGRALLQYPYTEEFMLRFPFLYLSIYFISFLIEIVRAETQKQLEEAKRRYRHLYRHDALTGLYNRYGLYEFLEKIPDDERDLPLAVVMLDIDHFKSINDRYGHEFGDRVLVTVADTIRGIGEGDVCCRWGGEEFLLISRRADGADETANRICRQIAAYAIPCDGGTLTVTVSAGVCRVPRMCDMGIHEMIDRADKALYRAKRDGGNGVAVAPPAAQTDRRATEPEQALPATDSHAAEE